jgi:hypothetical protein
MDDEFANWSGCYDEFYNEEHVKERLAFIETILNECIGIKINEYYDGLQVTITTDAGVSRNILLGESFEKEHINSFYKLMELIHMMKNLTDFSYTTRFAGDTDDGIFDKPLKSVKNLRLGEYRFATKGFIDGKEKLTINHCYSDDDEEILQYLLSLNVEKIEIELLQSENPEKLFNEKITVLETDGL